MIGFSTLDSEPQTYASSYSNPDDLGLLNPDAVLGGTSRAIQNLGGPNMYADSANNRIVVAPQNVPKVVMGNQDTFGQGFYVAKDGVNALTNTDPSGWIFNSNQNVLKILKSGIVSFPALAAAAGPSFVQNTVSYDTGVPATQPLIVQAYVYNSIVVQQFPIISTQLDGAATPIGGSIRYRYEQTSYVQNGTLWFDIFGINYTGSVRGALTIKYLVLQESAV